MNESARRSGKPHGFQVSVSTLTLGTLYEAVLAFSSEDRFESFWPSVCQNSRWLIPSRRMGILLFTAEGNFETVGMFEQGKFQRPMSSQLDVVGDELRRVVAQQHAQWIERPFEHSDLQTDDFTRWLLRDRPETLFVLPLRAKRRNVGALLFAMGVVGETDQAMLNTLGTIYALHVGMTSMLLRVSDERRQMQERLILQEKMVSLGSLVAGILHEINSPVGTIKSASDVAARSLRRMEEVLEDGEGVRGAGGERQFQRALAALRDGAAVIAAASQRIITLVGSLKNFVRLDEAEYQKANIHEGIDSALTLLGSELKDRITVVREYDEDIPKIGCCPGQLNQVFMSLLKNSIEAIEGRGEIRIKTYQLEDGVQVEISDTGRGIPPEKLAKIFDFDLGRQGSRVKMGLGLPTAYNIVQGHGGRITVESQWGAGSTFTLTLPDGGSRER